MLTLCFVFATASLPPPAAAADLFLAAHRQNPEQVWRRWAAAGATAGTATAAAGSSGQRAHRATAQQSIAAAAERHATASQQLHARELASFGSSSMSARNWRQSSSIAAVQLSGGNKGRGGVGRTLLLRPRELRCEAGEGTRTHEHCCCVLLLLCVVCVSPRLLLCTVGTFGRVLECWDRKVKDYCAVKIVRNVDKYRHAAMIEVGCGDCVDAGGVWAGAGWVA